METDSRTWEQILEQVEAQASRFLNEAQIAEALGIGITTLAKYKREYAHFAAALKRGRGKMRAALAVKISEMALEGNPAAAIFLSKVHLGWRESYDVHLTGDMELRESADAERRRQMQIIRCLTPDERAQWLELQRRAEARFKGEEAMPQLRPVIEIESNGEVNEQ